MEKVIRWGIVGAGNIANKFATAIKNVEGAKLTSVASRSKGKPFAEKYNIKNVYESYEEMAASDEIDAVYIATPHPLHKSCAELYLNAKKHVLCEKPMCVNASQAIKLKECAKRNGVFLMEALWTRFLPAIKEAVNIVNSGVIGEIRGVKADFCYSSNSIEEPNVFSNSMAGGSLLDVGIYGLNFSAIFLEGNPESIISIADVDDGIDKQINILMKYNNGKIASVSSGITVNKPETGYIYGTKGYITIPRFFGANEFTINVNGEETLISKPSIGDGFEEEIIEACNCIRTGKNESDIMPLDESIRILKQMDYIRAQNSIIYPHDTEGVNS